ncbi:hypothetical protein Dsin_016882 [Dipteronia sinensis]|uniref:Uncharacterized protein n=1 Tax=Dipteronia sinensis TaxID=43782 RepID=A0AAE0AEJ3_9ROSI|nr:hypothetical protein Dsin_016882 [Dipteronia sinensis]
MKNDLDYDTPISGSYNMKMTEIGHPVLTPDDCSYKCRFGGVDTQPSTKPDTLSLKTSRNILKHRKKDGSSCSSSSSQAPRAAATSGAELNMFFEAQFDSFEKTYQSDLLKLWKTYN